MSLPIKDMTSRPIIDGDFYNLLTRDQLLEIKKKLRPSGDNANNNVNNNANNNAKAKTDFDLSDVPSFGTGLTETEEAEAEAALKEKITEIEAETALKEEMALKAAEVSEPVVNSLHTSPDVLGDLLPRNVGYHVIGDEKISKIFKQKETDFKNKISTIYDLFDSLMITFKEETYKECIEKLRVMKDSTISHDKENLACIMSHLQFFDKSLYSRVVADLRGRSSTPSTLSTASSMNNNSSMVSSSISRTQSLQSATSLPQTPNGSTHPSTGGARRGKLYIA